MSSVAVCESSEGVGGRDPVLVIRPLASREDFAACVTLQRMTWGEDFRDVVQPSLLMVAQKVGGVAAGAFGPDGVLWGFVFGLTGVEAGRPVHWSHMLAVRPEVRDCGVGRRLKEFQRAWLRERQVSRVYWTFDPLVARNAHLNLNRLGADVVEFVPNMYGPETGSPLHAGLGTDRLLVVWQLEGPGGAVASERPPRPSDGGLRAASEAIRIDIPSDIQALKDADPASAMEWRNAVRAAFTAHLAGGWRVLGLDRDVESGRCAYVLARSAAPRELQVDVGAAAYDD